MLSNGYEVLLVSQFTLLGYFSGNKPDYHLASMKCPLCACPHATRCSHVLCSTVSTEPAKAFFDAFCNRVRAAHSMDKVAEGVFGAYMEVSLVRDTPKASSMEPCKLTPCLLL